MKRPKTNLFYSTYFHPKILPPENPVLRHGPPQSSLRGRPSRPIRGLGSSN